MRICLVGSKGQMGRIIEGMLSRAGHEVVQIDAGEISDAAIEIPKSDFTVLAVPLSSILVYIEEYSNRTLMVEVSSVKAPLLKYSGRIISIHPLFGPHSFPENRRVCFIDDISADGTEEVIREMLPECELITMTSGEHDRMMAGSLVAPYMLSLMAGSLNAQDASMTRSGSLMENLASVLNDMNSEVVSDTIRLNPNTPDLLDSFELTLRSIREASGQ